MIKCYKVAGHEFQLEMPESHPLWPFLTQYEPFLVQPSAEPVFRLSLVEELPESEKTPLLLGNDIEKDVTRIDLYSTGNGLYVEMAPVRDAPVSARLLMSGDFSRGSLQILRKNRKSGLFSVNNAMMLLFAFSTVSLDTLEMHSSVICSDGRGFLFLGKSGTGKSTHSSMWLKAVEGCELMNDDNPIVRVCDDGVVRVYGSPWSGKTPCYRNVEAPVGAFVQIRRAKFNKASRMSLFESYATLYSSCSGFKVDPEMGNALHRTMEKVVLNVPFWYMDCLPDEDAARVCSEAVKGEACNG